MLVFQRRFLQTEPGDRFAAEQLLLLVHGELPTLAVAKLGIATDWRSSNVSNRLSTRLSTFCLLVVLTFAAQLLPGTLPAVAAVNRPISLVFDTDLGNDI